MLFIRSLIFNIAFYLLTAAACIVLLPALLLPKKYTLELTRGYFNLLTLCEKYIVGITYSVEGTENIPKDTAYIVAAKHYSTYETMKLFLLFHYPAVILKRELMRIPLWGWYAKKFELIAINRGSKQYAVESVVEGAKRVIEQKRPIIIFPQGTRIKIDATTAEKPYKSGVAHMAMQTGLPVVPLAHNSCQVWPRKSFMKYPGHVVFKFLEPLKVDDTMEKNDVLSALENVLEPATNALLEKYKDHGKTAKKA